MNSTKEELERSFAARISSLVDGLHEWFENETAAIDGSVVSSAPAGTGGSIVSVRPAIDSKRVVDATLVTEEVLGIELPPEIIKPGGYESCEAMIDDIIPKLRKVYTGELKVKKRKSAKNTETA